VQLKHPALAACYAAAALGVGVGGDRAGQPQLRLLLTDVERKPVREALPDEPVAEVRGVNLYGKQWVDGRDRKQIERLARYITRPPIAQERLTRRDDGSLFLRFKKVWKDGSLGLVLRPEDLLTRLCAAVAPPRFHMVRYFGVLSSHSSCRSRVVPEPPEDTTCHRPPQLETVCGNGLIEGVETCDDGNQTAGDGCSATCRVERCGDGVRQNALGEQCDDGNTQSGDGCSSQCKREVWCGDGNVNQSTEECDDGANISGDGCSSTCKVEECGDAITQSSLGEECDDGNSQAGDGCRSDCSVELCGEGIRDAGEGCDDGNNTSGDGCSSFCSTEVVR
jgi:cysteine-rich repeat protein